MGKLESLSGGAIDWTTVVELGRKILAEQSKDLLVGAWLALALFETHGDVGLQAGIEQMNQLMQTFWEELFPKRLRARSAAIQWMNERLPGPILAQPAPSAGDLDLLRDCKQGLDELKTLVWDKLADEPPALGDLQRAVAGRLAPLERPDDDAVADAAEGGQGPASAPAASGPVGRIASRAQAFQRLQEVVDYLQATEPQSPVAYLIQRAINWRDQTLNDVLAELLQRRNSDALDSIRETLGIPEQNN